MVRFRARWGFALGSGAFVVSLEVSLRDERVQGGGRESVLVVSRWAKGGRRGDSGWGLGLIYAA